MARWCYFPPAATTIPLRITVSSFGNLVPVCRPSIPLSLYCLSLWDYDETWGHVVIFGWTRLRVCLIKGVLRCR